MGVKSTRDLSRNDAEDLYVELYVKVHRGRILAQAAAMERSELEHELERMNDKLHGGEGFDSYRIVD